MTDFVRTMKDWSRMCKSMPDCDSVPCPMFHKLNLCTMVYNKETDWEHVEQIIDNWARSNPENPHYPTWCELLYGDFLKWYQERNPGKAKDEAAWFDYLYNNEIPADIAKKLGIEPRRNDE